MPENAKFKREVRARMARTGERYMQARAAILAEAEPSTGSEKDAAMAHRFTPDTFKARANEAQDAVLQHFADIRARLLLWTVPMFFVRRTDKGAVPAGNGSGVLFRAGNRHFILTAGHCVAEARGKDIIVPIARGIHSFRLEPVAMKGAGLRDELDFGYIEVSREQAAWMESQSKAFISPKRLCVLDANTSSNPMDLFILAGFPAVEVVTEVNGSRTPRPIEVISINVTQGPTPPSPIAPPAVPIPHIDLWLPEGGMVRFDGRERMPGASVPDLQGASGGGWWYLDAFHRPDGWTVGRLRLAGTHMGSTVTEVLEDGRRHRFARGVLIQAHLQLLLTDYPELKEAILPAIEGGRTEGPA